MKITTTISRLLLGLVFTVFGLNGFLNLFSTGPVATPSPPPLLLSTVVDVRRSPQMSGKNRSSDGYFTLHKSSELLFNQ